MRPPSGYDLTCPSFGTQFTVPTGGPGGGAHIQRNTARNSHLTALMRSLIAHTPSPAAETASAASSRAASVNP